MIEKESLDKSYFEAMYLESQDPWNFTESPYEQEKYAHTLSALKGQHFSRGLEIGCSIGVLSAMLAEHCEQLLAVDISEKAIAIARERLPAHPVISFETLQIPHEFPEQQFDLIVVSEVGYYLSNEDLRLTRELIFDALAPGGTLCLVHWRPQIEGCAFNGDEVHACFLEQLKYSQGYQYFNEKYRIDLIEKRLPADSAALHKQ